MHMVGLSVLASHVISLASIAPPLHMKRSTHTPRWQPWASHSLVMDSQPLGSGEPRSGASLVSWLAGRLVGHSHHTTTET